MFADIPGGTYTLTFGSSGTVTTSALAPTATPTAVQTALAALTAIGSTSNVSVLGPAAPTAAGGTYLVLFKGTLANQNLGNITSTSSLTPNELS